MQNLTKRRDGKFEQSLGEDWSAEYFEDIDSGLWDVEIYLRGVPKWRSMSHESLEEAQQAVRSYMDQL